MSSIISRRRHPAAGYAAVAGGLVAVGVGYAALTGGGASAAAPAQDTTQTSQGHSLFIESCATCHGLDAQGTSVAPSLISAGAAAVDFQMSTGRMPAKELGAENDRKPSDFTPARDLRHRQLHLLPRRRPVDPGRQPGLDGRRQHGARPGAVQHQLRPVPRLRRGGRRADLRQERAVAQRGDADPDLRGDADRPGGDAGVRRRRRSPRPRRKTSSATSSTRGTRPTPAASPSAAPARSPRACWPGSAASASSCSSPCGSPPSGGTEWSTSERISSDE